MYTAHHIKIAHQMLKDVQNRLGVELDASAFIHGNILPDFHARYLLIPHTLKGSKKIMQQLDSLFQGIPSPGRNLKQFSENLGILCHFISDSFCFAHSPRFTRNLLKHHLYEISLYHRLKDSGFAVCPEEAELPAVLVSEVLPALEGLYDRYFAASPSPLLDIQYSYLASWTALYAILVHCRKGTSENQVA